MVNAQVQKNRLDYKVSAYTFMLIIGCMLVVAFVIGSTGADFSNFWETSIASIILYFLFLVLFFILCSQLKLKGREIPKAIDLNKKLKEKL